MVRPDTGVRFLPTFSLGFALGVLLCKLVGA